MSPLLISKATREPRKPLITNKTSVTPFSINEKKKSSQKNKPLTLAD